MVWRESQRCLHMLKGLLGCLGRLELSQVDQRVGPQHVEAPALDRPAGELPSQALLRGQPLQQLLGVEVEQLDPLRGRFERLRRRPSADGQRQERVPWTRGQRPRLGVN